MEIKSQELHLSTCIQLRMTKHPSRKVMNFMSHSIPTGYIPPGNPGEFFFKRANPGHPGNFFCLIPCPRAKVLSNSPGVGQNFPKLEETAPY